MGDFFTTPRLCYFLIIRPMSASLRLWHPTKQHLSLVGNVELQAKAPSS